MLIGQTLSTYRITAALGAGGMGEVYRATDTKLGREVAIKVLPAELAEDAERLARFEREAQLLAALNHPNVGAIYGLEEAGGKPFLVLELVEGEELQQRIERGPIPVEEAIEIARQIAEGLEAAHEKGVVHRDLKPANVKLTPDGKVKVLDFGLAKAWAGDPVRGSSSDMSQSPTLAHTGTQAGVILGTAAYMSPEQARGKPVDRRTDVWAFGAVLWEMLTGRKLFAGDTASDTMAAVLTREPDWTALPAGTPASVQRLLRRTLERDVRRRLQAIGEARVVLEHPGTDAGEAATGGRPRYRSLATAAVAAAAVFVAGWFLRPAPEAPSQPVRRLDLGVTDLDEYHGFPPTISPDGSRILYRSEGRLWVRSLDRREPLELEGTEGAQFFFWSPDGTQVGYLSANQLWTIAADGGPAHALAAVPRDFHDSGGGAWGADGRIVLSGSDTIGLLDVPERGGEPRTLLELDREHETDFHEIAMLPEGRGVVFTVHRTSGVDTIELFDGASRKTILKLEGESLRSPFYSPSGHILYARESTIPGIWALPFSLETLEKTGEPFLAAPEGSTPSVSQDGTLSYVRRGLTPETLLWVDQSGQPESLAELPSDSTTWNGPLLSPDGSRVVLCLSRHGNADIWSYEIPRGTMTRLTFHTLEDLAPIWSADGEQLLFASERGGGAGSVYSFLADGSGEPEALTEGKGYEAPLTTSPDGRWLIFSGGKTEDDLWKLHLGDGNTIEPLVQSQFAHLEAAISPNGRWVAYTSNESGRFEVYVQSFPDLGNKQQLSTEGGTRPRWSGDGRQLFFRNERRMMVVDVSPGGEVLRPAPPRVVFELDVGLQVTGEYDVASDGRFLMVRAGEGSAIALVLNWFEELRATGR